MAEDYSLNRFKQLLATELWAFPDVIVKLWACEELDTDYRLERVCNPETMKVEWTLFTPRAAYRDE